MKENKNVYYVYVSRFFDHMAPFSHRDLRQQIFLFCKSFNPKPSWKIFASRTEDAEGFDISIGPFEDHKIAILWKATLINMGYKEASIYEMSEDYKRRDIVTISNEYTYDFYDISYEPFEDHEHNIPRNKTSYSTKCKEIGTNIINGLAEGLKSKKREEESK